MRVDARPKARPTAKRLQFRRGCRHLVTATADIVCQWFGGQRTADKVRPASFSSALPFSRISRPHSRVSFMLSYLVLALSFLIQISWHESKTKLQPNMRHREDQVTSLHQYYIHKRTDSEFHAELSHLVLRENWLWIGRTPRVTFGSATATIVCLEWWPLFNISCQLSILSLLCPLLHNPSCINTLGGS